MLPNSVPTGRQCRATAIPVIARRRRVRTERTGLDFMQVAIKLTDIKIGPPRTTRSTKSSGYLTSSNHPIHFAHVVQQDAKRSFINSTN